MTSTSGSVCRECITPTETDRRAAASPTPSPGAGMGEPCLWGRLAACAAVGYRRCPVQTRGATLGVGPIANRPQLDKLPHNTAPPPPRPCVTFKDQVRRQAADPPPALSPESRSSPCQIG